MSAALSELKARLGALERTNRELIPWSPLPGGLPRGGLVEISGRGKTEAVALLLAENPKPAAWIEQAFSLLPSAFLQRSVSLDKIFFIEGGKNSSWAAATVLRSQLFPFVIYSAPYGCERELRRFQLLAERSRSTMILLAQNKLSLAWPIALSLEMREGRPFVLRRK